MRLPKNTEGYRRELSLRAGDVILYGTFGLLLIGPLAFGAVEPWSIFLLEVGSASLFSVWVAKQILDAEIDLRTNPLFLPLGIFAVLILAQLVFRVTAYSHDTISIGLQYCAYAMLCFLAGQCLLRASQVRTVAVILSVYGAVVAGFALIQGISSNGKLYWIREPRMGGWIYGSYVNHNHYAGAMEMLIPIPLVLSLTHLAPEKARVAAATAATLMVGTIFLSGSRGGMLAIVAELTLLSVFLIKQRRGLRTAIGAGISVTVLVVLLTWVGGSELGHRLATFGSHSDLSGDVRASINRDGFLMFLQRPVLGWGLGAFPVVYPRFRSFYTNFFVNEAHNDYLQLLVEMGILGFATMLWFLVVLYRRALKKTKNWTTEVSGAAALACLLGVSGILVHSAFDFNLHIPANAALFYVLSTMAAAEPFLQPVRRRRAIRRAPEIILPMEQTLQQPATNF